MIELLLERGKEFGVREREERLGRTRLVECDGLVLVEGQID